MRLMVIALLLPLILLGTVTASAQTDSSAGGDSLTDRDLDRLLRRFVNARWAGAGRWNADGTELLFRTNITGSAQVWRIPATGGWPHQVTFYDDSISVAEYSPADPDTLVFGKGEGGNERLQFYLASDDGSEITPLTDNPEVHHRWGAWGPEGERLAWTSNERDSNYFDVWVYDIDSGEDRMLFANDSYLSVAEFSPEGDKLLVTEWHSNVNSDIYLVDVETGEAEHLTEDGGENVYSQPRFRPGTDWVYLVSNRDRDVRGLARINLESGEWEWLVRGDWPVADFHMGPDGEHFAYTTNEDGFGVPHVVNAERMQQLDKPEVPEGVRWIGDFDPTGNFVTIQVSGPKTTTDLWRYDLKSAETERLTFSATGGIPAQEFIVPEVVRYQSFDGLQVSGLLFEPEGERPEGGWPVIVDAHGGPESQSRPTFSPLTQLWLEMGIAVFQPNVRGSDGYGREFINLDNAEKREDSVRDLVEGVDHMVEMGVADAERVAVTGASYGGYMVLGSLTLFPERFAAGIDIVGIANFETFLENTGDYRRALREAEYGSLENREMLREISPIHKVDRIEAPLLVIHGENDPRVPVSEARQIHQALQERGRTSELLVFSDEGHGIAKLENRIESWKRQVHFIREHLLGESSGGQR